MHKLKKVAEWQAVIIASCYETSEDYGHWISAYSYASSYRLDMEKLIFIYNKLATVQLTIETIIPVS